MADTNSHVEGFKLSPRALNEEGAGRGAACGTGEHSACAERTVPHIEKTIVIKNGQNTFINAD
jgi:hypothetical protein